MTKKQDICLIVEKAKQEHGTSKLAEMIGVHRVQINSVIRGDAALPFSAALKLADILEADPITITCANSLLMEKDWVRKEYLKSKISQTEVCRIIYIM